MKRMSTKQLRAELGEYTSRSTTLGVSLFLYDMAIYILAIAGVILLESLILQILCGILAGLKISLLFVIAHDAAHASLTNYKFLNKLIARLSFLPCYHNYSLWLKAHNKSHHLSTNVEGENSWSPLSKKQYDDLPAWRQQVERFYRTLPGISFNYLVERWWKHKFFPYRDLVSSGGLIYWLDFLLVISYMAGFLILLFILGMQHIHTSPLELILLAFILPTFVGSFMIGFTVYQQHTHESIPWFKNRKQRDIYINVDQVTMYVKFPRWYNILSHNTMEHTAHHIDSTIPLYHLAKAQQVLTKLLGDQLVTIDFSFRNFLATMRKCKLYDYDNYCWLDFDGIPSSTTHLACLDMLLLRPQ